MYSSTSRLPRCSDDVLHQRMLGRKHDVRGAEECVRPCGEDLERQRLAGCRHRLEGDARALGSADPVGLHRLDLLWPLELVQVIQQPLRVGGDPQEPLFEVLGLDLDAAALVHAALCLFIGHNDLALGAPVHRSAFPVGEPLLVHLQEDPLRPLVVLRARGVDLPAPVVHGADFLQLALHVGYVLRRADARMHLVGDGEVLCRQSEGIPPHRVQNVHALQGLVPTPDVAQHVAAPVPDVQPPSRKDRGTCPSSNTSAARRRPAWCGYRSLPTTRATPVLSSQTRKISSQSDFLLNPRATGTHHAAPPSFIHAYGFTRIMSLGNGMLSRT